VFGEGEIKSRMRLDRMCLAAYDGIYLMYKCVVNGKQYKNLHIAASMSCLKCSSRRNVCKCC
jgi:hypothetical protein